MGTIVDLDEPVGLAEALFDNEAEWPDELVFNRGDILHVLDQHPAGGLADGWWLCADKHGRRGIAPANRLKMIHSFGQGQERVITPRRFGDVFLYNHRLFGDSDDEFFQQPQLGSLLGSAYDVPSALRNLYLLHASDHPYIVPDKIGTASSSPRDLLAVPGGGGGSAATGGGGGRQPVVRNVPIKLEGREGAEGTQKTSDRPNVAPKSPSAIGNPHRSRSPPPPPPLRRHFNLTGPLVLSSLVPPATTSSTSSNASDEEWAAVGQLAPGRQNGPTGISKFHATGNGVITGPMGPSGLFYDTPSSLFAKLTTSVGLSMRAKDSPTVTSLAPTDNPSSLLLHRTATADQNGNRASETAASAPPIQMSTSSPAQTTYDVPRSARSAYSQNGSARDSGDSDATVATSTASTASSIRDWRRADILGLGGVNGGVPGDRGLGNVKKLGLDSLDGEDAERLSISSMDSKGSDYQELLSSGAELRLSAGMAMDTLIKLLETLQSVVDKLNSFATPNWRRREYLESHIMEIRASCRHTIAALKDFFDFSSGAFVNVHRIGNGPETAGSKSEDGRLAKHLAHLVRPLGDSLRLMIKLQQSLDISGWTATKLTREGAGNDSLDQFVAVAKQVPQDARQVALFVQGNISMIFPVSPLSGLIRTSPLNGSSNLVTLANSRTPVQSQHPQRSVRFANDVHISTGEVTSINGGDSKGASSEDKPGHPLMNGKVNGAGAGEDSTDADPTATLDDYDYVGEPAVVRTNGAGKIVDDGEKRTTNENMSILSGEDKQILQFYAPQVENHIACLSNAIDDFLASVEQNQAPKDFVGHSKFVILGAHKLVYIGDSVAQCLQKKELSEKVKHCANNLCDMLKGCVTATKQAALQYPAIPSIQAMVDSMVNVSQAAYELKLLIQEAADL